MAFTKEKLFALCVGVACHGLFLGAVFSMMASIFFGLHFGLGRSLGALGFLIDVLLVVQFPLLHSFLLTERGRRLLKKLSPAKIATEMNTTWFALIASVQLLLTFVFWCPLARSEYEFHGFMRGLAITLYACSWLFLLVAMIDADLSLQSGAKGWWAVLRGKAPRFYSFPKERTFAVCRQPIYLSFALILWTAPVWTWDRLFLAVSWTAYCYFGPKLKEARYRKFFGDAYVQYQQRVSYFLPLGRSFGRGGDLHSSRR